MSTPIWLMDVDGVLNNFGYLDPLIHADFRTFESGNGYMISYSESLMKRITDLQHSGAVDIRWLTTWQGSANLHLRGLFGFDQDLLVEGGECDMSWEPWWKLPIASQAVQQYERVIWTDDEIDSRPGAQKLITHTDPSRLLTVSPYPCLTHDDLDYIESWL